MASPELGRLLSLFPFCWRVFSARVKDASTSESGPRQPWGQALVSVGHAGQRQTPSGSRSQACMISRARLGKGVLEQLVAEAVCAARGRVFVRLESAVRARLPA